MFILDDVKNYKIDLRKDKYTFYHFWVTVVRSTVVGKLSDEQAILSFKDDPNWAVRVAVVAKLSDEQLIVDIFKNYDDMDVRKVAMDKLSDKDLIAAFNDGLNEDNEFSDAVSELSANEGLML